MWLLILYFTSGFAEGKVPASGGVTVTYILFVLGFYLMIKGADILVDGATTIARRLRISDIVIGLTIVSFGTSMPELVVNIIASFKGSSEIAIGNVLGSNIANILLILGVASLVTPLPLKRGTILSEIPFSLIATLLVGFLANAAIFGDAKKALSLSRIDGLCLLLFFGIFMLYVSSIAHDGMADDIPEGKMSNSRAMGFIVSGCIGLFFGGKWVVDGAIVIAKIFGMSETFIGLTVVAVGTSLPELVTSAMAAYRGSADIAVGNAIGSNIFNLLWILGISATIRPLPFDHASNSDLVFLIFTSLLLFAAVIFGERNKIDRWQGFGFLIIYSIYTMFLIFRG